MSLAGRDIGELPAVVNPERKNRAATDFRFFCEAYFPFTFHSMEKLAYLESPSFTMLHVTPHDHEERGD